MDAALVENLNRIDPAVLGARVKAARKAAGMTQPQMGAGEASAAYISRIERGERRPSPHLLDLFCRSLGVSPERLLDGPDPEELRRLELELDYADLSLITGDTSGARSRARAVLDEAAAARHPHLRRRAQLVCADADAVSGRYAEAVTALEDYLESEPTSPAWPAAATSLSRVLRETGQLAKSAEVAQHALDRLRVTELAGTEETIRLSVTLAAALCELGDVGAARRLCEKAIADSEALDSPRAQASAFWNTSVIETEAGNLDRAVVLARRALELLESVESTRNLSRLRTQLGEILLRTDPPDIDSAVAHLRQAAEDYAWSDSSESERQQNQLVLARAELMRGDLETAAEHAHAVLDAGSALPYPTVTSCIVLGQVAWTLGRHNEARDRYTDAVHVLTSIGADREAAQTWFDLGNLLAEAGMHPEASDAFRRSAASTGLTARSGVGVAQRIE